MNLFAFRENGLFQRIFGFLGKLIALNLLWIVFCLPVVTAGASTTALFYCTLKLHKDGDISTFRDFFKSFRQNFLQATIVWIMLMAAAAALYLESRIIPTMPGMLPQVFSYLLLAVGIPLILITLYVFPTLAAFESKIGKLVTNALFFALKKCGYALAVAAITLIPMFFTLVDAQLFPIYLFVWIMCGFSLTAYAASWFFWRLYRPYLQEAEEELEKAKSIETDQYVF